jgi:hypothetical protein
MLRNMTNMTGELEFQQSNQAIAIIKPFPDRDWINKRRK